MSTELKRPRCTTCRKFLPFTFPKKEQTSRNRFCGHLCAVVFKSAKTIAMKCVSCRTEALVASGHPNPICEECTMPMIVVRDLK